MDTGYTFTVTEDNQIIFTKDEYRDAHEKLIETIGDVFKYPYEDADYYAKKLEHLCLTEYSNKFRRENDKTC